MTHLAGMLWLLRDSGYMALVVIPWGMIHYIAGVKDGIHAGLTYVERMLGL